MTFVFFENFGSFRDCRPLFGQLLSVVSRVFSEPDGALRWNPHRSVGRWRLARPSRAGTIRALRPRRGAVRVALDAGKSGKSSLRSRPASCALLPPVQVLAFLAGIPQLPVRQQHLVVAVLAGPFEDLECSVKFAVPVVVRSAVLVDQLSVPFGESGVGGGRLAGFNISPAPVIIVAAERASAQVVDGDSVRQ